MATKQTITTIDANDYDYDLGTKFKKLVTGTLATELCKVRFIKADGTTRDMLCTLLETFMPLPEATTSTGSVHAALVRKQNNPYLVTVWDVEKMDWRAFSLDRFVALRVI